MARRLLFQAALSLLIMWMAIPAIGKEQEGDPAMFIIDVITADSANTVTQPDGLNGRLIFQKPVVKKKAVDSRAGYRVQIYSAMGSKAGAESLARIRTFSARFPQYGSYRDYNSPYWKVLVGDFKTEEEAREAAARIRGAFPAFARQVRVVPSRINLK